MPIDCHAVTLTWTANDPIENVTGYKIYYGSASRQYRNFKDVGNFTSCELENVITTLVAGKTYYLAATAYSATAESDFSTAVVYTHTSAYQDVESTDTDGDGISDTDELNLYGTDPYSADSDNDGISDGDELDLWAQDWDADYDADGIINLIDWDSTLPVPPTINTYLENPGFESGTSSWLFHTSGTGTFSVASPGFDGSTAAKFALNSRGTNIQLYQKGITLEPNTRYRLSFAGYSTSGHDVMVRLIKHVSPYNNYGLDLTADLGTSWQKFTTEFTTTDFTGTVNDGRLQFWLAPFGAPGDTYYIDDIRLEKVDEVYTTEPDTTGTTVIQNTSLNHPNMYINQNEINAIKAKVLANQEPWKSAYNQMISDANRALSQAPLSVNYTGNSGHDYYTETPYITDGVFNPGADREDYTAAKDLGKAVRSLGLAYAFTGDSAYADKAIELIDYWCLNSSTYMTPSVETNLQSHIELYVTMPGMFYGADLIYDYTGWDSADKADFLDWVEDIAINAQNTDLTGVCNGCVRGNYENWRHNFVASAGSLLDDNTLLSYAFNDFKTHIPNQISRNGEITSELRRTKSLDYSMYAINAMVQTAEIARHQGVNLYDYTSNGRNLELALDYHAPYVVNSSTWPYEEISVYDGSTNGNAQVYELAYSYWQKAPYLNVLNYWGRPMYEIRILGPVTLTHSL